MTPRVADGLQLCAGADYGGDRSSQTRLINEAARVVAASLKLANGFTEAAVTDSEALLLHNFGDSFCRKYNTEAHVSSVFFYFFNIIILMPVIVSLLRLLLRSILFMFMQ